jgi:hypothetical protein
MGAIAAITWPSNFLAARITGFTASLCHAKITPAALHRGKFAAPRREADEAAAGRQKFGVSDFAQVIAGSAKAIATMPWLASS